MQVANDPNILKEVRQSAQWWLAQPSFITEALDLKAIQHAKLLGVSCPILLVDVLGVAGKGVVVSSSSIEGILDVLGGRIGRRPELLRRVGSATRQTPKQATPPRALGCRDDIEDAVV
jgi:hypothetical protein